MMRITSGLRRGKKLLSLQGENTRPTLERIKQAFFNAIQFEISNKTVLSRHPWVTNVEHELSEIEADKQADLEEMEATLEVQNKNKPKPNSDGGDE